MIVIVLAAAACVAGGYVVGYATGWGKGLASAEADTMFAKVRIISTAAHLQGLHSGDWDECNEGPCLAGRMALRNRPSDTHSDGQDK